MKPAILKQDANLPATMFLFDCEISHALCQHIFAISGRGLFLILSLFLNRTLCQMCKLYSIKTVVLPGRFYSAIY